jgi:cytochrome bd-type quinol oxidase subunit 2
LYASGYLILSVYCASLGISFHDPFKSKIVATGMTFTLLAGAPIWGAYRLFVASDTPKFDFLEGPTARFSFAVSSLYTFCILLAFTSRIFFDYTNNPPRWTKILLVSLFVLDGVVWATIVNSGRIQNYLKGKAWMLATFVMALIAACGYLVATDSSGFGIRHIAAWFFICGMVSLATYYDFAALKQNRHKLPLYIFQVITYVAVYATLIYPHISNRWGGGLPVDVTVTFSKDSSVLPARSAQLKLVEEDDAGIFILTSNGKHAIFVPKASIGAIVFTQDKGETLGAISPSQ